VRQALNNLKTIDITVPIWDQTQASGGNTLYHVVDVAVVRLVSYQLPNHNRITVTFKGFSGLCGSGGLSQAILGGNETIVMGLPMRAARFAPAALPRWSWLLLRRH
jgi:hypothetical protein